MVIMKNRYPSCLMKVYMPYFTNTLLMSNCHLSRIEKTFSMGLNDN